ncbi:hypothetical protein D3C87_2204350 [compost metagenome]
MLFAAQALDFGFQMRELCQIGGHLDSLGLALLELGDARQQLDVFLPEILLLLE